MKLGSCCPDAIYDLNAHVTIPDCSCSVLPDWSGRLWFVSKARGGRLDRPGDRRDRRASSFLAKASSIRSPWTRPAASSSSPTTRSIGSTPTPPAPRASRGGSTYDRGTRLKPGHAVAGIGDDARHCMRRISSRSPTTPTRACTSRSTGAPPGALVCRAPVFEAGQSATENSIIAAGNSLVVENNYGYEGPDIGGAGEGDRQPGVARVDVDAQAGTCRRHGRAAEISPTTVPKASLASGPRLRLLQAAERRRRRRLVLHRDRLPHRHIPCTAALPEPGTSTTTTTPPVSIGPDGSGYIGTLGGLIRIADG